MGRARKGTYPVQSSGRLKDSILVYSLDILEQVYLLAEILKAAPIPSHVLFGLIRDANIQPRWNDMALPPGKHHSSYAHFQLPRHSPILPRIESTWSHPF
jgi:hypothetical protein